MCLRPCATMNFVMNLALNFIFWIAASSRYSSRFWISSQQSRIISWVIFSLLYFSSIIITKSASNFDFKAFLTNFDFFAFRVWSVRICCKILTLLWRVWEESGSLRKKWDLHQYFSNGTKFCSNIITFNQISFTQYNFADTYLSNTWPANRSFKMCFKSYGKLCVFHIFMVSLFSDNPQFFMQRQTCSFSCHLFLIFCNFWRKKNANSNTNTRIFSQSPEICFL